MFEHVVIQLGLAREGRGAELTGNESLLFEDGVILEEQLNFGDKGTAVGGSFLCCGSRFVVGRCLNNARHLAIFPFVTLHVPLQLVWSWKDRLAVKAWVFWRTRKLCCRLVDQFNRYKVFIVSLLLIIVLCRALHLQKNKELGNNHQSNRMENLLYWLPRWWAPSLPG